MIFVLIFVSKRVYQIVMREDFTDTSVGLVRVAATDADEGDYGNVLYKANDKYFRVDPQTVSFASSFAFFFIKKKIKLHLEESSFGRIFFLFFFF